MLQSAQFRDFEALRDLSIDLERLTVPVGATGCGKSSALAGTSGAYPDRLSSLADS